MGRSTNAKLENSWKSETRQREEAANLGVTVGVLNQAYHFYLPVPFEMLWFYYLVTFQNFGGQRPSWGLPISNSHNI